jgi:hypothetical protein
MTAVRAPVLPMLPIELTLARSLAILATAGLVLGACGGGGANGADRDDAAAGGVEAPSRTADAEPAGTDPDAVRPYIEELLVRYDQVVNEIVVDPSVARDPDDPLVQQYLDLYEPGSEFAGQLIDAWVERADEGLSTRPINADHPTAASRIDGDVESTSADEVSFPYCVERRFVVVDDAGRERQHVRGREQSGEGVAVRVDGVWRLRELTVFTESAACRSQGL